MAAIGLGDVLIPLLIDGGSEVFIAFLQR